MSGKRDSLVADILKGQQKCTVVVEDYFKKNVPNDYQQQKQNDAVGNFLEQTLSLNNSNHIAIKSRCGSDDADEHVAGSMQVTNDINSYSNSSIGKPKKSASTVVSACVEAISGLSTKRDRLVADILNERQKCTVVLKDYFDKDPVLKQHQNKQQQHKITGNLLGPKLFGSMENGIFDQRSSSDDTDSSLYSDGMCEDQAIKSYSNSYCNPKSSGCTVDAISHGAEEVDFVIEGSPCNLASETTVANSSQSFLIPSEEKVLKQQESHSLDPRKQLIQEEPDLRFQDERPEWEERSPLFTPLSSPLVTSFSLPDEVLGQLQLEENVFHDKVVEETLCDKRICTNDALEGILGRKSECAVLVHDILKTEPYCNMNFEVLGSGSNETDLSVNSEEYSFVSESIFDGEISSVAPLSNSSPLIGLQRSVRRYKPVPMKRCNFSAIDNTKSTVRAHDTSQMVRVKECNTMKENVSPCNTLPPEQRSIDNITMLSQVLGRGNLIESYLSIFKKVKEKKATNNPDGVTPDDSFNSFTSSPGTTKKRSKKLFSPSRALYNHQSSNGECQHISSSLSQQAQQQHQQHEVTEAIRNKKNEVGRKLSRGFIFSSCGVRRKSRVLKSYLERIVDAEMKAASAMEPVQCHDKRSFQSSFELFCASSVKETCNVRIDSGITVFPSAVIPKKHLLNNIREMNVGYPGDSDEIFISA